MEVSFLLRPHARYQRATASQPQGYEGGNEAHYLSTDCDIVMTIGGNSRFPLSTRFGCGRCKQVSRRDFT
jgi:hypothetical protein